MTTEFCLSSICENESTPIEDRFSSFVAVAKELDLMSFVAFVMYKHVEHTDLEKLSADEMEIVIKECRPLLTEALEMSSVLQ